MRYNEVEELESTREWLIRFNEAGFSDELLYVPSQLSKLGVAPIDVVDRLEYLKSLDHGTDGSDHDTVEVVHEESENEEETVEDTTTAEPEALVEVVETLEEKPAAPVDTPASLVLDYDSYEAWEWMEPIEKVVEDAFASIFELEPGLEEFNKVVALTKSKRKTRGKRARASMARVPQRRADELVSSNSVGANE